MAIQSPRVYSAESSFASLVRHPNYHWHVVQQPGFNLEKLPELLDKTHKRLKRVQIECLPYEEILKRFDRPTTLFYCDPPYLGTQLYRYNFSKADFSKLAERLRKIRGKFILSLNDVPEVRALFTGFRIQEISLHYTSQKAAGQIAYAVVRGICQKIVFLQDPTVSHPHDSDIRLFEQALSQRMFMWSSQQTLNRRDSWSEPR